MFSLIYVKLLILLAPVLYWLRRIGQRPRGYPPGPPTLPIFGNFFQMTGEHTHEQLKKWADKYGSVYSLILGTKVFIVLSHHSAIKDLLDKKGNIYSSRPETYLANMVSNKNRMLLMPTGKTLRMLHNITHNALKPNISRNYIQYLDLESKALLIDLIEAPSRFDDHIRRYTNSSTTQMIFGFRTTSADDPKLKQLFYCFERFSEVADSTAATLLDLFPLLRRLPDFLLPQRQHAKRLHEEEKKLYTGHWVNFKEACENGTAKSCIARAVVQAQDKEGFSDESASYVVGSLLEAGSDTTAATLIHFMLAAVHYPEVMRKAQAEIDKVCGDRLPVVEDMTELRYIIACCKEILRWGPTAITGVPHAVTQDDEYKGYKIPRGATVICNVYSANMDAQRYENPQEFNPDRFEDDFQTSHEAATNPDSSQRDHFTFGAGRRLCQGMYIADRSIFLFISRLLWGFDIGPVIGANGKSIIPDPRDLTKGLFVRPKPFPVSIQPRYPVRTRVMRKEWEEAEKLLDENFQWKETPQGIVG